MTTDTTDDFIETSTGRRLYINTPRFDAAEICWSLAFMCRYTGHCARFYSVLEHTILVAEIMRHFNLGDPFEGLMHDGTESVLNDINSPNKRLLPDYKKLEAHYDNYLRRQFHLPPDMSVGCKLADWVALVIEARQLLPTGGEGWSVPEPARKLAAEYEAYGLVELGKYSFAAVRRTWADQFNTYKPDEVPAIEVYK